MMDSFPMKVYLEKADEVEVIGKTKTRWCRTRPLEED